MPSSARTAASERSGLHDHVCPASEGAAHRALLSLFLECLDLGFGSELLFRDLGRLLLHS